MTRGGGALKITQYNNNTYNERDSRKKPDLVGNDEPLFRTVAEQGAKRF
jgi:hypothetical protein